MPQKPSGFSLSMTRLPANLPFTSLLPPITWEEAPFKVPLQTFPTILSNMQVINCIFVISPFTHILHEQTNS